MIFSARNFHLCQRVAKANRQSDRDDLCVDRKPVVSISLHWLSRKAILDRYGCFPSPIQYVIYIYILSFFKTYETFPAEITREHAREHFTRARARRASISDTRARDARAFQTRARETREQRQARACLKCSRARAAHPAAGEAPYMNPYVLNQANLYIYT